MTTRPHPVRSAQRLRILKRDNYTCQYCFEDATEVDHILPHSYKVVNADSNLVASCGECNRLASNMVFTTFNEKYMYIKRRRQQRGNRGNPEWHVRAVRAMMDEAPPVPAKVIKPPKVKVEKPLKIIKPPKAKVIKPAMVEVEKLPRPKPANPPAVEARLIGFFGYVEIVSVTKVKGKVTSFAFVPIDTLPKDNGGGINDPEIVAHVFKGFKPAEGDPDSIV